MKPAYISFDGSFERKFKKYRQQLTEAERRNLRNKFELLKENVFDRRLKTHKLKGNLSDYYSFAVNYSDRIVFKILDDDGIYLIEIGDHDTCY